MLVLIILYIYNYIENTSYRAVHEQDTGILSLCICHTWRFWPLLSVVPRNLYTLVIILISSQEGLPSAETQVVPCKLQTAIWISAGILFLWTLTAYVTGQDDATLFLIRWPDHCRDRYNTWQYVITASTMHLVIFRWWYLRKKGMWNSTITQ